MTWPDPWRSLAYWKQVEMPETRIVFRVQKNHITAAPVLQQHRHWSQCTGDTFIQEIVSQLQATDISYWSFSLKRGCTTVYFAPLLVNRKYHFATKTIRLPWATTGAYNYFVANKHCKMCAKVAFSSSCLNSYPIWMCSQLLYGITIRAPMNSFIIDRRKHNLQLL